MPPKRCKDQAHFVERFQSIYQQDYTKWLVFGRKRGYADEVIADAIQETSLKVLDIEERLSELNDLELHAYVMTIYKNMLSEIVRDRGSVPLDDNIIYDEPSPEEEVINQMDYEKLSEVVKKLSDQQQQYIYMKYYLGLSSKDIGKQMGIKDNAVRTMKHRAVSMLRRLLSVEERSEDR